MQKQPPATEIINEPDGMVRLIVGDQFGWVSSHHLVPTKECQLIKAWKKAHNKS